MSSIHALFNVLSEYLLSAVAIVQLLDRFSYGMNRVDGEFGCLLQQWKSL